MKKQLTVALITALALFSLTACSAKTAEAEITSEPTREAVTIAEGRLVPVNWLEQSFTLSGRVASVIVSDGQSVNAGDPLAALVQGAEAPLALARAQQEALAAQQALDTLVASAELSLAQAELAVINATEALEDAQADYDANDSAENKALLDAAAASLTLAEDALARAEEGDGIDADSLAAAEARLTSTNAALTSAEEFISAHTLTASLDGTVVDIAIQPGQLVSNTNPAMVIADLSAWVVETDNLSEMQVSGVEVGQQVEIVLDALPGLTLTGEVTHINARFEEKRGDITYTATILLNEVDPGMRWGMTAAVYFK